jgi:hypothetical protein
VDELSDRDASEVGGLDVLEAILVGPGLKAHVAGERVGLRPRQGRLGKELPPATPASICAVYNAAEPSALGLGSGAGLMSPRERQ